MLKRSTVTKIVKHIMSVIRKEYCKNESKKLPFKFAWEHKMDPNKPFHL